MAKTTSPSAAKNENKTSSPTSKRLNGFFDEVGMVATFAGRFFKQMVMPPYEWNELLRQSYLVGVKSISLIGITGFIMGLVLTIQSRPTLAEFGAQSWLPAMVSISIVREIGPVITALICAGKVGSGIGAELASMNVTEQIDAMEVSAINPFKYVVVTRVLSTTLMVPVLVVLSDAIAFMGSFAGINIKDDITFRLFFHQAFERLQFSDVLPAFIKSFFFGFIIGLIACFKGYHSNKGTESVGAAANSAVVVSSLLIFILDMMAAQVTDILFD